jgi:predicted lipid-binding transport protein (Tim44 family)
MNWLGRFQLSLMVLLSAITVLVCAGEAVARPGGGFSLGSRGLRSLQIPPTTGTAPRQAMPLDRSMTQPGQSGALARNGVAATPRAFHRPGLLGGLAAGFIGAGLLGMLFGNGFFGGLGGLASMLGLLAQIAVVAGIGWLAWSWWQRRGMAAFAGLSPRQLADAYDRPRADFAASLPGDATADGVPNADLGTLQLSGDDFDTFERLLGEIQTAHARADVAALRTRVTPEMLDYFAEELPAGPGHVPGHGLLGDVGTVTLLRGDLSEAWREREADYASVAMRYALDGFKRERGGKATRVEVTEVWTFRRAPGGDWQLSAIQQT